LRKTILSISLFSLLMLGCVPGGGGEGGGSSLLPILPFVVIFALFYFLILRPQQKQNKARKEMLANIKRGDDVITSGGIYGKILNISENNVVTLEIAKNVSIHITKDGITGLSKSAEVGKNAKEDKPKK